MGEFFRGWRRKAGLVSLAMACLLMATWFRSHVVTPQTAFLGTCPESIEFLGFEIISDNGSLELFDTNGFEEIHFQLPSGQTIMTEQNLPLLEVPYLWLVLPLSLLSAWLILAKPRKRGSISN